MGKEKVDPWKGVHTPGVSIADAIGLGKKRETTGGLVAPGGGAVPDLGGPGGNGPGLDHASDRLPLPPALFVPRVWYIVSREKFATIMDTRKMFVDAKMAAGKLLAHIRRGEYRHFDEVLAEVRTPKEMSVTRVVIRDDVSNIELEFELNNREDKEIDEFVAGLNKFEEHLVMAATQAAMTE